LRAYLLAGARNPVRRVRCVLPAVLCRLRRQGHVRRAVSAVPTAARPDRPRVGGVQRVDAEPHHLPRVQPGLPARLRDAAALRLLSAGDRGGVEAAPGGVVRRPRSGAGAGSTGRGRGRSRRRGDDGRRRNAPSERCRHPDLSRRRRLTAAGLVDVKNISTRPDPPQN